MKFPNMFSPVQIGTVTVPNRFVVPPMGNDLANTDGSLSERSLSYYQARAKGGFGLITIESTVEKDSELGGNLIVQVKDSRIALDRTMANRVMI